MERRRELIFLDLERYSIFITRKKYHANIIFIFVPSFVISIRISSLYGPFRHTDTVKSRKRGEHAFPHECGNMQICAYIRSRTFHERSPCSGLQRCSISFMPCPRLRFIRAPLKKQYFD